MEQRAPRRHYTPAEYFALEERSEVRHEYFDGEVFAMAGGTKSHNLIAQNVLINLRAGLRGTIRLPITPDRLREVARRSGESARRTGADQPSLDRGLRSGTRHHSRRIRDPG